MTTRARAYISAIALAGVAILTLAAIQWRSADLVRYLGFLFLAVLAATRKVRLPRSTSNISIGFLFILLGIAVFSFSEAVVLAAASALMQSLWAKRRPNLVQVLFNLSVLALSAAAGFGSARLVSMLLGTDALIAVLPVATTVFFLVDTSLVAGVVSITELRRLGDVWQQCSLWAFPYYLLGSGIAGLVAVSTAMMGWKAALVPLPLIYLIYVVYRMFVERAEMQHT